MLKLLRLKATVHFNGTAILCCDPVVARKIKHLTYTEDLTAVCSTAGQCSNMPSAALSLQVNLFKISSRNT